MKVFVNDFCKEIEVYTPFNHKKYMVNGCPLDSDDSFWNTTKSSFLSEDELNFSASYFGNKILIKANKEFLQINIVDEELQDYTVNIYKDHDIKHEKANIKRKKGNKGSFKFVHLMSFCCVMVFLFVFGFVWVIFLGLYNRKH